MDERTCAHCDAPLPIDAHHRRRFCDRTCERASYKVAVSCSYCGVPTLKDRYEKRWGQPFCSFDCRDSHRHGADRTRQSDLPAIRRRERALKRIRRAAVGSHGASSWVAGRCAWCQSLFVFNQPQATTCSRKCSRQAGRSRHKAVRRARIQGVRSEPINNRKVFERDGWRCGICHKPVARAKLVPHPRAPTIDHIIPLSQGGDHLYVNVQCACFECNWRKGDRGVDQLRLIG